MAGMRTLPWDWYAGEIPGNVWIDDTAYVETSFSFFLFRSQQARGIEIGKGASAYQGTMFDVGPAGRVTLGNYALVNGARIISDSEVSIGDYTLISWNVLIMDSYRLPFDPESRRSELEQVASRDPRWLSPCVTSRPVHIDRNVWIGFDACILPGVNIGEGAIVGAKSVVVESVHPYTVVAGNPARVVRRLQKTTN